jgi:hypothetical protein
MVYENEMNYTKIITAIYMTTDSTVLVQFARSHNLYAL